MLLTDITTEKQKSIIEKQPPSPASDRTSKRSDKDTLKYHNKAKRRKKNRKPCSSRKILYLTIGDTTPTAVLTMPAFPMLYCGMHKNLSMNGMNLLLANSPDGIHIPTELEMNQCDGVIAQVVTENRISKELETKLKEIPTVLCCNHTIGVLPEVDHITYNNSVVGAISAKFMKDNGVNKVAFFISDKKHYAYRARMNNFIRFCNNYDIEVCVFSPSENEKRHALLSKSIANKFLNNKKGIKGAVFCSDYLMLGVCSELRAKSYNINKLKLLGCNNDPAFLNLFVKRPATVDIGLYQHGVQAIQRLTGRINGTVSGPGMEMLIPPALVKPNR